MIAWGHNFAQNQEFVKKCSKDNNQSISIIMSHAIDSFFIVSKISWGQIYENWSKMKLSFQKILYIYIKIINSQCKFS